MAAVSHKMVKMWTNILQERRKRKRKKSMEESH